MKKLQFWWFSKPQFEFHREVMLATLGLQPVALLEVYRDSKGREINRIHEWSEPYGNYLDSNPLKDSWSACQSLSSAGFMEQDDTFKTAWKVTEKGLEFLEYFANRIDEYELKEALRKVKLENE